MATLSSGVGPLFVFPVVLTDLTNVYSVQPIPFLLPPVQPEHLPVPVPQVVFEVAAEVVPRGPGVHSLAAFFIVFVLPIVAVTAFLGLFP